MAATDMAPTKPVIRTIHHFAASGGTVMSKALAAQPDTVLLSEVTPFLDGVHFNPLDPVHLYLAGEKSSTHPASLSDDDIQTAVEEVFGYRVQWILQRTEAAGQHLVLRDHAHSEFITKPGTRSALLAVLGAMDVELRSVVTLRNPIDSYIPALMNGWLAPLGTAPMFDAYCVRLLNMLDKIPTAEIFLYEDFCADPVAVTQRICAALDLPFDAGFVEQVGGITLTGDSGRSGSVIEPRPRRPLPVGMLEEINTSAAFAELAERFWPKEPLLGV